MVRLLSMEKIVQFMEKKKSSNLKLSSQGYMDLVVEKVGEASLGSKSDKYQLYSFCHYGKQNGDMMRDPDLVVAVSHVKDGEDQAILFSMVSLQNDYAGFYSEARYGENLELVDKTAEQGMETFAQLFSKNIRNQGFLDILV